MHIFLLCKPREYQNLKSTLHLKNSAMNEENKLQQTGSICCRSAQSLTYSIKECVIAQVFEENQLNSFHIKSQQKISISFSI